MFRKILIANRGEIAVRIIRAARELGIATVAVYSTADKEALHTLLADEAVCIGPGKATESYLNINAVLSAAVLTEAEAIHPGFGFLSENSKFATMCEEVGIKFIGPSGHVMDMMGDKINARAQMIKAGVPVIPGSDGEVHNYEIMFRHPEADNESYYFKETGASLVDVAKGLGLCGSNPARGYEGLFELANLEYRAGFDNRAEDIELLNKIFSNPPTHYETLTFNVKEGEDFYDYLNFAKIYVSDCGRNMDYYYTDVTGGYIGQNRLKVIVYWPNWK